MDTHIPPEEYAVELVLTRVDKYFVNRSYFIPHINHYRVILKHEDVDICPIAVEIVLRAWEHTSPDNCLSDRLNIIGIREEYKPYFEDFCAEELINWWVKGHFWPSYFCEKGSQPSSFKNSLPENTNPVMLNRGRLYPKVEGVWLGVVENKDVLINCINQTPSSDINFYHATSWRGADFILRNGPRGKSDFQDFGTIPKFYLSLNPEHALEWCLKMRDFWSGQCAIVRYNIPLTVWNKITEDKNNYLKFSDDSEGYSIWRKFVSYCRKPRAFDEEYDRMQEHQIIHGPMCSNSNLLDVEIGRAHV
jgi:hypothetical protein